MLTAQHKETTVRLTLHSYLFQGEHAIRIIGKPARRSNGRRTTSAEKLPEFVVDIPLKSQPVD